MAVPDNLMPRAIRSYINFDGTGSVSLEGSPQSRLQSEGVAALWLLLQSKGFAYLGDEVGMGKTRQAMGVIATQFLSNPASRVVIICPGRTLQDQWLTEWKIFLRECYLVSDNCLRSAIDRGINCEIQLHDRLSDFARSLIANEGHIHLLRYSSFSRPIRFVQSGKDLKPDDVFATYSDSLRHIGISEPSAHEFATLERYKSPQSDAAKLARELNEAYAHRIGRLVNASGFDLVVCDEAQYLRHVDNQQNTNLRQLFRSHVSKWLFMSATPLHSGAGDICSLDAYICQWDDGPGKAQHCTECPKRMRCPNTTYRYKVAQDDIVSILKDFLVRRIRTYVDRDNQRYTKVAYRRYERHSVDAAGDPFLALTMALVQKRLVSALGGRNNQFRQGECSSFESLSTSLGRMHRRDGIQKTDPEIEYVGHNRPQEIVEETPDRTSIDSLNENFRKAMFPDETISGRLTHSMPHGKLLDAAERLFKNCLKSGVDHKVLVFVRRLDTVEELRNLLLVKFQEEVDRRIELWRGTIPKVIASSGSLWAAGHFWTNRSREDNEFPDPEDGGSPLSEDGVASYGTSDGAAKLPYFESLKRGATGAEHGMLASFHARLLRTKQLAGNPLKGLFLVPPLEDAGAEEWATAESLWERFVRLILDAPCDSSNVQSWTSLLGNCEKRDEDFWRIATVKRCILQSMRQTDFIVDLYILNRFLVISGESRKALPLPEKMLWFLGEKRAQKFQESLEEYSQHWKRRFRQWFEHFYLIADKSLREGDGGWEEVLHNVDSVFARMAPVFGRSGRLDDKNAVKQFKLPVHPNVLIATDVLKEGVDLHPFCDEVMHYGVAWTSGDLEQRIGRLDRVGSLINRRIANYGRHNVDDRHPRLRVEFPYLDGTLDKYQVERVIKDKIRSDLRLDLGKRKEEIGVIRLEDLEAGGSSEEALSDEMMMAGNPFDAKNFLGDGHNSSGGEPDLFLQADYHFGEDREQYEQLKADLSQEAYLRHVPIVDAICYRIRCTATATKLLRLTVDTGRRKSVIVEEEYLVPLQSVLDRSARQRHLLKFGDAAKTLLASTLQEMPPSAVLEIEGAETLSYDRMWNTMSCSVVIDWPFESGPQSQAVILECVGEFWLLRTPVLLQEGNCSAPGGQGWDQWIASQNQERKWGYLAVDRNIVWLVAFVLPDVRGASTTRYLERIAQNLGRIGDSLQRLYRGSTYPYDWKYRSSVAFPASFGLTDKAVAGLANRELDFAKMNQTDLLQSAQLLAGLNAWVGNAFEEVVRSLCEASGLSDEQRPEISPVKFSHGGVLHISTESAERFRLQAFLELDCHPGVQQPFAGPRLIWELVASPKNKGPKPKLSLSSWAQLPHNAREGWEKDGNDRSLAYTHKGDKYRYLILYHSPELWNSEHSRLILAWKQVVKKMQSTNNYFEKSVCRSLLINAIAD